MRGKTGGNLLCVDDAAGYATCISSRQAFMEILQSAYKELKKDAAQRDTLFGLATMGIGRAGTIIGVTGVVRPAGHRTDPRTFGAAREANQSRVLRENISAKHKVQEHNLRIRGLLSGSFELRDAMFISGR